MSISSTDETLLKLWFNERDADSFKALCTRHAAMVYATCVRILHNETEAEDVVQSCFETLSGLQKRPRSPLGPWLHKVATNRALDVLKSDRRRKAREQRSFTEKELHTEILWEDIYGLVDEAIEELPEKLRVALVAHFLEDQTHEFIARREGVSRAAITQRIGRGIEGVRETLKRRGITVTFSVLGILLATDKALAVPPSLSASLGKLAIVGMNTSSANAVPFGGQALSLAGSTMMNKTALAGAAMVLATIGVVAFIAIKNRDINSFSEDSIVNPIDVAARSAIEPRREDRIAPPTPFDTGIEEQEATINNQTPDNFATTDVANDEETTKSPPELRSVSGYVVDKAGIAIAGAVISLSPTDIRRVPMPFSAAQQETLLSNVHLTTSNTTGFFSFPRVTTETALNLFDLEVSASGYFMPREFNVGVGPGFKHVDLMLSLEPGLNLYGEIRDPAGRPLPGALITSKGFQTKSNFTGSYAMHRYGHSSTVSDSDGHFLLGYDLLGYDRPELLTGITTLEVRSGLLGATVFPNVFVGADEVVVLQWPASGALAGTITGIGQYQSEELTLAIQGTFRIQFLDEFGQPTHVARGGGTKYEVPIPKDGQYRIEGISVAQTYEARIRNDQGEVLTPTIPLAVFEGDETQEFDYILTQPVTISGVVRGALSGRPLRDVQVRWRSLKNEEITDLVEIEDDGTYCLELRAPAGTYVLYPTFLTHDEPQYREIYGSTISIEPGGEYAVYLTFLDPVTRTVVAIDEFGDPIADAGIAYREFPQSYSLKGRRTDETGRFTYHGVRPYQESSLVVVSPISEFENAQTEAFAAEPGQVVEEEVVILRPKAEPGQVFEGEVVLIPR